MKSRNMGATRREVPMLQQGIGAESKVQANMKYRVSKTAIMSDGPKPRTRRGMAPDPAEEAPAVPVPEVPGAVEVPVPLAPPAVVTPGGGVRT